MERINKKSFVFSMDAFFAILLFVLVTVGIYTYFISFYSIQQQWYMSEDTMNLLSNTKIKEFDLDSGIYPNMESFRNQGIIDIELTVIEQIDILIKQDQTEDARLLVEDLISPVRGERYGFSLSFEDIIDPEQAENIYESGELENRLGIATSKRYLLRRNKG